MSPKIHPTLFLANSYQSPPPPCVSIIYQSPIITHPSLFLANLVLADPDSNPPNLKGQVSGMGE